MSRRTTSALYAAPHKLTYDVIGLRADIRCHSVWPVLHQLNEDAWEWCDEEDTEEKRRARRIALDEKALDTYLRFVVLGHDPGSGYLTIEDVTVRRRRIIDDLLLLGCTLSTEDVTRMAAGRHELVLRLSLAFLRSLPGKARELAQFLAVEASWWEDVAAIYTPAPSLDPEAKIKFHVSRDALRKAVSPALKLLNDVAKLAFSGDDSVMGAAIDRPVAAEDESVVEVAFAGSTLTNPAGKAAPKRSRTP